MPKRRLRRRKENSWFIGFLGLCMIILFYILLAMFGINQLWMDNDDNKNKNKDNSKSKSYKKLQTLKSQNEQNKINKISGSNPYKRHTKSNKNKAQNSDSNKHSLISSLFSIFATNENSNSNSNSNANFNSKNDNDNSNRPNILFILTDDQGWADVGYHSDSKVYTPNIDSLVTRERGSLELNQYYTQCVCTPSRGTILTGKYPIHNGLTDIIPRTSKTGLPLSSITLAEILRDYGGYDTYLIGKWHLGFYKWEYTPTWRGFDQFYGFYTGAEDYFTHKSAGLFDFREEIGQNCGQDCSRIAIETDGLYSTHLFTDYTIKNVLSQYGIDKHKNKNKKNKNWKDSESNNNPFFILLSYQAVHSPRHVPDEYWFRYNKTISNIARRQFAGMTTCMDESIGYIIENLKKRGLWDNTIVIFASDNGGATMTADGIGSRNYPLRGGKHSIYEGGTRVVGGIYIPPKIWHMSTADENINIDINSGVVEKNLNNGDSHSDIDGKSAISNINRNNIMYNNMMHSIDWLPTLLDAANVPFKFDPDVYEIDGVSHWQSFLTHLKQNENENDKIDNSDINNMNRKVLTSKSKKKNKQSRPPRTMMYYGHNVPNQRGKIGAYSGLRINDLKLIKGGTGGDPTGWNLRSGKEPKFNDQLPPTGSLKINLTENNGEVTRKEVYSLYNLSNDPNENNDIARQFEQIVIDMAMQLDKIEKTKIAPPKGNAVKCVRVEKVTFDGERVRGPWCK